MLKFVATKVVVGMMIVVMKIAALMMNAATTILAIIIVMIMAITVVGIKTNNQTISLTLLAPSGAFFVLMN